MQETTAAGPADYNDNPAIIRALVIKGASVNAGRTTGGNTGATNSASRFLSAFAQPARRRTGAGPCRRFGAGAGTSRHGVPGLRVLSPPPEMAGNPGAGPLATGSLYAEASGPQ